MPTGLEGDKYDRLMKVEYVLFFVPVRCLSSFSRQVSSWYHFHRLHVVG